MIINDVFVGKIQDRLIGQDNPCFIIAEAGVNHNADLKMAKKMIDCAVDAGADAIKFQTFSADTLVTKTAQKAEYQKDTTGCVESQYQMIKNLELSYDEFKILSKYAKKKGIIFLSTPFDNESVDFLNDLDIPAFKIPSGEITNFPLLAQIASKKKPVILSTGMSNLAEIEEATTFLKNNGAKDIFLLHCVTNYPADIREVNLRAMDTIRCAFKLPVGYSDHTMGITISIAAVVMGACIIEKHFTLDRNLPGPDHRASLEPDELKNLVLAIREVELGKGSGLKKSTPEEEKNKLVIRKSLVAKKDISMGEQITVDMLTVKRPGTGIEPRYYSKIIGSKAIRSISKDELIEWHDITLFIGE